MSRTSERSESRVHVETESGCCARSPDTPPWVAALWWLSVSLVMSLAALTQVICMQADSGWDVRQRQWCTYHFPRWLIEDCNLCWTFSLITHVSGSKTRTLSCHCALCSSWAFSLQVDWSPPLRWAQFFFHLHHCYKCRIECIQEMVVKQRLSEDDTKTDGSATQGRSIPVSCAVTCLARL